MLRSLPRVACNGSTSLLATATTRRLLSPILSTPAACLHATRTTTQHRQAHAISNPTLAGIEKRWEAMPPQEQAELWMALRDRMKADWHDLTLQEKKAGTFHTPAPLTRALSPSTASTLCPGFFEGGELLDLWLWHYELACPWYMYVCMYVWVEG